MAKVYILLGIVFILQSSAPVLSVSPSIGSVTNAIQDAIEKLVADAQDKASASPRTFIINTLSRFSNDGIMITDPVVKLSVNQSSTVGLFEVFRLPDNAKAFQIPLASVTFDHDKTLAIVSRSYGNQNIISEVMELKSITFNLTVDIRNASSLIISFGGEWTISEANINVQVTYLSAAEVFDITATPSQANINLVSLANNLTGLEVPNPFNNALAFDSMELSGTIYTEGRLIMALKLISQANKVYLIYHKLSQSAAQKMIAADFANVSFSSLISQVSRVNVSQVPFFGSLTIPRVGLTRSIKNITDLPARIIADSKLLDLLLTVNGESVAAGVHAALNLTFFGSPIAFRFPGSLQFTSLGGGLSLNKLLSEIPDEMDFTSLPFDIDTIRELEITSLSLSDHLNRSLCIEVGYNNGIQLFKGLIEISSVSINLCLSRQPTKVRVNVSGTISAGFRIGVFLDETDNYIIHALADIDSLSNALAKLRAPPELRSVLSNIPNLNVTLNYVHTTGRFNITVTSFQENINLVSLASALTGLDVPNPLGSLRVFDSIVLSGTIYSEDRFTMAIKLVSQANKVYLICHKLSQSTAQKMIAADFANVSFSSLISQVSRVNVSQVPFFGSLTIPRVGLIHSTKNITDLPAGIFTDSKLLDLLLNGESVAAGVHAALNLSFFGSPIAFRFPGSLQFTSLGGGLSLNELLSEIPDEVDFTSLPFDINTIRGLEISSLSLSDHLNRSLCIEVGYNNGIQLFEGLIEITSVSINLCLSRRPTKVRVNVSGTIGAGFRIGVFLDETDNYIIHALANTKSLSNALAQLRIPPELMSVLSNIPNLNVTLNYTHATGKFNITVTSFRENINLVSLASNLTGLNVPNPFGRLFEFESIVLSGTIYSEDRLTVVLKLVSHQASKIYLIYHKLSQNNVQKMIAADFANFRFSSLISQLTKIDISGVPYFGSLTIPGVGLTLGNVTRLSRDIFDDSHLLELLTSSGESIATGISAAFNFDLFTSPVKFTFAGAMKFTTLGNGISLNRLLSLVPGVNFGSLPLNIGIIRDLDIISFSLADNVEQSICMEVHYNNELQFFNNFIEVSNAIVNLCLPKNQRKARVNVSGDMGVGGTTFNVTLFSDEDENYIIEASANRISISNVLSQFQARFLPPKLNSLLSNIPFLRFSVQNPRLTYPLSSSPQQIQIGGTPIVDGFRNVRAEVLITDNSLIAGFNIGSVNLAKLIKAVTTIDVSGISILNQELQPDIVISPKTFTDVHLHGDKLANLAIRKGVSLQAEMHFPSDCSSDIFCDVAQRLLGANTTFHIRGTMEKAEKVTLFAGVSNFSVGSGLTIRDAGLQIEAPTEPSAPRTVGLTGTIVLQDPAISLKSMIHFDPSIGEVRLSVSQLGCWENAFGASWLSICNFFGSIPLSITGFEVGGQIKLGDPSCSTPINATGYVGIDAMTPTNNYYYVQFDGKTTVSSLFRAFCKNRNLPRPLSESGFPEGFLSSFSLAGRELESGISVPAGFRLNGTFNILGLRSSADVTVDLPRRIDFSVALPPINIGNVLRMYESASSTSRGPSLRANIAFLPSLNVNIQASGYFRVLGISVGATLRISNTQYEFSIAGRMLNLFQADLTFRANYGRISRASFSVRGSFKADLFNRVTSKIKGGLRKSADAATRAVNKAQQAVNEGQAIFDAAVSGVQSAQRVYDGAQSELESAEARLRSAQDEISRICRTRSCGSKKVCVPCPKGTTCCGRAFRRCVCYLPRIGKCCETVTDPICLTENEACRALRKAAELAVIAAEALVDAAQLSLRPAQEALRAAQVVADRARDSLDALKAALKAVADVYRLGTDVVGKITSFGLNGLVRIDEITFETELRRANSGSFSARVKGLFLGVSKTLTVHVNIRDPTDLARRLADNIGDGFSSLF